MAVQARSGVAPVRSSPAPAPTVPAMSVAPHVDTGPALIAGADELSVTKAMLLLAVAPDAPCVAPAWEATEVSSGSVVRGRVVSTVGVAAFAAAALEL